MRGTATGPLHGRRVVVTRAHVQADDFVRELEALGAEVVRFPTIRTRPPADPEPLRRAAAAAASFDWIVFTSANAINPFCTALAETGGEPRVLDGVRICAVGSATGRALRRRGFRVDLIPTEFVSEAVADALAATGELAERRVLLPRARGARAVLPERLRGAGAEVVEVEAYVTVPEGRGRRAMRERLARGNVDVITFTAGSTVRGFARLVGTDLGGARVVSIGPVTSAAARDLGMQVDVEASDHTMDGLLQAVLGLEGRQCG